MITEDYVSFKTAQLLKEKGFDEYSTHCYCDGGALVDTALSLYGEYDVCNSECSEDDDVVVAPTHQMAMKWLREVYGYIITIPLSECTIVGYGYNIQTKDNPEDYYKLSESVYNSYEEAVECAIKYCLENLI